MEDYMAAGFTREEWEEVLASFPKARTSEPSNPGCYQHLRFLKLSSGARCMVAISYGDLPGYYSAVARKIPATVERSAEQ